MAAGSGHVCVVGAANNVTCSGEEFLGNSTKATPPAGIPFMAVTVGNTFSCGLVTNASAVCWGEFPGAAPNPATTFIDIHAGANNLCGLQAAGAVLCYGNATAGVTTVPAGVYQGVSTGTNVACAVRRNHSIACWGDATNPVIAALPPAITDADHVSVGATRACYITTAGGLVCWGDNAAGQAAVPAGVSAVSAVWWVSAGSTSTCVIAGSSAANMAPPGRLTCWGEATGNWSGTSAYEVACASWGCIVSEDAGGSAAKTSFAVASMLGVPIPRTYNSTTYAGSGTSGYADGIGTNAQFMTPSGFIIRDGTMLLADKNSYTIRRVNLTTANVTRFAGQPGVNSGVDSNINPLNATFQNPYCLEYGAAGDLYVYDYGLCSIRKISPAGVVTTIAGKSGTATPAVDGVGTNVVLGVATDMRLDSTSGIIYLPDFTNNRVRALYPNETVGTVADIGGSYPRSLVLDTAQRTMYVGTMYNILKISYAGAYTLFSGSANAIGNADGPAAVARFNYVQGLERDAAGNLYATDYVNCRIRKVSPDGTVKTILGGTSGNIDGVGTNARLGNLWGLRMAPGGAAMYVADNNNRKLRRVDIVYVIPPAPLAVGNAPLPPSPIGANVQLTAWRVVTAVVDAQSLSFSAPLTANNTAGMNPAIRALALGIVNLAEQPGAGPADSHSFSSSARRGLHAINLTTGFLPPYSLALPALETLDVESAGVLTIAAHSFAGLDDVTCINCGATPGLANFSGLGLRSSATPGDLTLLRSSDFFNISGISALDLSGNGLTSIGQHDFDGAAYITHLYIGGNPGLSSIHCAAFTAAQQPLLSANNTGIDETGNPPSAWRAGCPSPSATPSASVTASPTVTPSVTETAAATLTGTATPSYTPSTTASPSVTPSATESPTATASATGSHSATTSTTASPSVTPSTTASPSVTPSATATSTYSPTTTDTPTHSPTTTGTPTFTSTATGTPTHSPSATVSPSATSSASGTSTYTPTTTATSTSTLTATGTPTFTPSTTASPSATPTFVVAAASSGLSKADRFSAALALGLLSVAFIAVLVVFRNASCGCRGGGAGTASQPPPPPPAGHGTVVNVTDATDGATAKPASVSDATITVTGTDTAESGEARGTAV